MIGDHQNPFRIMAVDHARVAPPGPAASNSRMPIGESSGDPPTAPLESIDRPTVAIRRAVNTIVPIIQPTQ